jgi:predicted transcriptional regulator
VVNQDNKLVGSVSLEEMRRVLLDQEHLTNWLIAVDLVNSEIPRIDATDDLAAVMKLFSMYDIEEIPVMDPVEEGHIIGSVHRKEIIDIYNKELVKRNISQEITGSIKLLEKMQTVDFIDDYVMAEVPVPVSFIGKSIKEVDIRARYEVQILMMKRESSPGVYRQIVPNPNEKFLKNDLLVIMAKNKDIDTFKHVS